MIDTLHIDDLDGTVTLFKSTDEGTETIAVFDEEHREVIELLLNRSQGFIHLLAQVKRLRQVLEANLLVECDGCKNWLIEEQIMQHPHHTQWGWVCYSCSRLRESDEE